MAKKLLKTRKPLFEDDVQMLSQKKHKSERNSQKQSHRDDLEGYEQSDWNDDERHHDDRNNNVTVTHTTNNVQQAAESEMLKELED